MHENPTFAWEEQLWTAGFRWVAGVDEVGRGALAGPVVAGALIVAPEAAGEAVWQAVRDSKQLSPGRRAALEAPIQAAAAAWCVGAASAGEIDAMGIAAATRLAMQRALAGLGVRPDHLLIDWVRLPQVDLPQVCVPRADQTMVSVAAASILAKVHRDRLMVALGERFPEYGFAGHKGYGAAAHLAALERCGPCAEHRRSFALRGEGRGARGEGGQGRGAGGEE